MVEIVHLDFNNPEHCQAEIDLMNHYMLDAMGDHPPLTALQGAHLIEVLREHPAKVILLAKYNGEYVGLINSFILIGTFKVKPFINIHDVIVLDTYRGIGAGRKLMEAIVDEARKLDCCKITLEVREDNIAAQALYKKIGFKECEPVMHFWTKYL